MSRNDAAPARPKVFDQETYTTTMTALCHYCSGAHPAGIWTLRPEDRYCALCGSPLADMRPRLPLLESGPPMVLAAYLWTEQAGGCTVAGRFTLPVFGIRDSQPDVTWLPADDAADVRCRWEYLPPATLRVCLEGTIATAVPGPCGEGRLRVAFRSQYFEFVLRLFALHRGVGRPWLSLEPRGRQTGTELVIFRGAGRGRTHLQFELAPQVPISWERIEVDHDAVTVQLPPPTVAEGVAEANVYWDPARLPSDNGRTSVSFQLRLAGIEDHWFRFRQSVRWRLESPLEFQPVGLLLSCLNDGLPHANAIRLRNVDRQPLVLERIDSPTPWVRAVTARGLPLRLQPGESLGVYLEIRPAHLADAVGPHHANLAFVLAGLGPQFYPICVEEVRRVRPLTTPLLIDPGPPGVVLARLESGDERPIYLRGSGYAGVAPDKLGVGRDEYARAAYSGAGAGELLPRLLAGVYSYVRRTEQLAVRTVVLCGRPWLSAAALPRGVTRRDFDRLLRAETAASSPAPGRDHLICLEAWTTYLLPAGNGEPLRTRRVVDALGAGVVRGLLRQFGRTAADADAILTHLQEHLDGSASSPPWWWLFLAVEALLHDYRWGAEYAWRHLLLAWWENIPWTRHLEVNIRQADADFRRLTARYVDRFLRGTLTASVRSEAGRCVWSSVLFASPSFAAEIQSVGQSLGIPMEYVSEGWVEWLSRRPANDPSPSPSAALEAVPARAAP